MTDTQKFRQMISFFPFDLFTLTLTFLRVIHNQQGLFPPDVCGQVFHPHYIATQSAVVRLPEIIHLDRFTQIFNANALNRQKTVLSFSFVTKCFMTI